MMLCIGAVMFIVGLTVATVSFYWDKTKRSKLELPGMATAITGAVIILVWAIVRTFK